MELPKGCTLKDISARYNQDTISRELKHGATLPPMLWGKLVVEEGTVSLKIGKGSGETVSGEQSRIIPAGETFQIAAGGANCLFHLEYYHELRISDGEELASLMSR